jgi:biofilm protein TabA
MVIDNLKNASFYFGLGKHVEKAFRFLQTADFAGMESGKYEIDGKDVYAVVKKAHETKPLDVCQWEAHQKHLDIHVLFEGTENMAYANIAALEVTGDYDAAEDIYWLKGKGGDVFSAKPGMFVIFTPEDAHMPDLAGGAPKLVDKVVIKVKA